MIAYFVLLVFCGRSLLEIYVKWQNNPVIIRDKSLSAISEIPFPTVTICPVTKVNKDKLNITNMIHHHMIKYDYNTNKMHLTDNNNLTDFE